MLSRTRATAFAPASIGNVGVGFDMLGLAISGPGDRVTAIRAGGKGVRIREVRGMDGKVHGQLSANTSENTAGVAAQALWDEVGDEEGIELIVEKGIPLKSGMGSSAASAVAGCVAANALLREPLAIDALLPYALAGEELASGAIHADNVAPSLLGGMILCPPILHPRMISLPAPDDLVSVLLHPELEVSTAEARQKLAPNYSMDQWLAQQGYLAGFVAALAKNDHELIRATLKDVLIEPQRAGAVPCFSAVQTAALDHGALGSSLSGSGPSIFALCDVSDGDAVAAAMEAACRNDGNDCQVWISPLASTGAFVESST